MTFNRKVCRTGKTWAFKSFVSHHTEINRIYWAFVPAWSYVDYKVRHEKNKDLKSLLKASGPNVRRIAENLNQFKKDSDDLANWLRLSVMMSAVSYFEIYMKRAITLSLLSDPAARFGKPGFIDGTIWLKNGIKENLNDLIIPCIKGVWSSRINNLEKLLGRQVPDFIYGNIKILEDIRTKRNKVAHSFGRDGSDKDIELIIPKTEETIKLKEKKLLEIMQSIFDISSCLDSNFFLFHIGSFEEIIYYHDFKFKHSYYKKNKSPSDFRKYFNAMSFGMQTPISTEYAKSLIKYYENI